MIRAILAILLALFGSTWAKAATSCSVTSTGVAFGIFSGQEVATFGTATVVCTGSGRESFNLALGRGSSGRFTDRTMLHLTDSLSYNLYTDPGHTQIWGDGNAGTTTIPIEFEFRASSTQTINVPIYADLPAQALRPPAPLVTRSSQVWLPRTAMNSNKRRFLSPQSSNLIARFRRPTCCLEPTRARN